MKILSINPGSTSTKIAVFEDEKEIMEKVLRHSNVELENYEDIYSQKSFRKDVILNALKEAEITVESLDVIVGRGGLLKPIEGGTYLVTDKMLEDLKKGVLGEHASNLGGAIAKEIADTIGKKAYIVDPVVVDELEEIARVSGMAEIERISIFHALNQKAVARRYCTENRVNYNEKNIIVAHLGGGVSVGIHKNGKVVDVNNALDGDGPFSPERSGGIPAGQLVKMCFSGKFSQEDIKKKLKGSGGIVSYLNTNDVRDVMKMVEDGDKNAKLIVDAMCYQIAKEIGALSTVVAGKVDAIILTGGISYSKYVVEKISNSVNFIAPITVYPGEDEMSALALGGLRVARGVESAKIY
ncbi:MAG: butyrate kinase [Fusobacteriaceae bacterium]|nr:butyrate kinase [Fusobacteriaceae bacterium]